MKVFQQMQDAIQEWQDSRSLLISIARSLDCNEEQILDKIERLKTSRPANDLNAINEKLEELQDAIQGGMDRAESVEGAVNNAYNELEYVDANDAVAAFSDLEADLEEFRNDIKKQLDESRG
tara:strand:+ start:1246 stop:1611 length:366 start_codon:yes stop_codon:yes gene_type:complete